MKTLEIALSSIRLDAPLTGNGSTAVLTELIFPRPGIALRSALKTVHLRSGKRSLERAPFYESGLMKENVDGRFGLKVRLTRPQSNPERFARIRGFAALAVESAGDLLAAGSSLSALRPLIRAPFDTIADEFDEQDLEFIAEGGVDLDPGKDFPVTLSLPLKLTRSVRITDLPPGPQQREKRKIRSQSYKKDSIVGEVVFALMGDD